MNLHKCLNYTYNCTTLIKYCVSYVQNLTISNLLDDDNDNDIDKYCTCLVQNTQYFCNGVNITGYVYLLLLLFCNLLIIISLYCCYTLIMSRRRIQQSTLVKEPDLPPSYYSQI